MRNMTWTRRDRASATRVVATLITCGLLASCGGGGGGGGPAAPTLLGRFEASLLGSNELSVADPSAKAFALVELLSDGRVSFAVAGEAAWSGAVTGLHIHSGATGANGPIVIDLLSDGATFDASTHVAQDSFLAPAAQVAQIAANPSQFYVNVHTSGAAAGLARGQLGAVQAHEWHALCLGSAETPPNASAARGVAALRVATNGDLTYVLALSGLAVGAVTNAHVHSGAPGVAGPVVLDLAPLSATADAAAGTLTATLPLTDATLTRLALDPAAFYVNVHTAAFPGGELRGALETQAPEVWAHLRGDKEVAVVDGAARGGATLELTSFTGGRAILAVPVPQGMGLVNGAHLHEGAAGVNGPIVVDLRAGVDYDFSVGTGSAEGSIAYSQTLYARLLAHPEGFYVNFHTAGAPNGLVRGQCTQSPQSLVGLLAAGNEVPPAAGGGNGKLRVILTGAHACSFNLDLTTPAAATISGLHVHDGLTGVNGPILIDLLGGSSSVTGSTISGNALFTGRTCARLLANAPAFYGNAHTPTCPNGAARGQLLLLTEDSPPAGLIYTSPVTYTTGVSIPNNVPDSVGGAITSYAVTPALPAGLALHATTGVISGTPTAIAASAGYTVTASNAVGFSTFVVNITVNEGPPTSLAYSTPVSYVVGTAITNNAPASTGGAITSYSVSPALPAGLALSTSTGVISGTPTAAATAADYTVTGSNGAGFVQATVNIKVDSSLLAPSGLSYSTPVTYGTGTAITPNSPTVGGGAVATWSVSPALPAGLALDASTGVIAGTPTTITSAATYTVTAGNATGSTTGTVNITVVLGAPAGLTYSSNPGIGYVSGGTFTTMNPSATGGAVASYSISPALPAGISINTTTGVISGSPTTTSAQTNYTVTATNTAGSTNGQVTITVLQ